MDFNIKPTINSTDNYNILCATDNNYVPYCGIMLTSLFENNKNLKLHVFILTENLNEENQNNLKRVAKLYDQHLDIIFVNNEAISNCPIRKGDHVSIATYYRLLAPELLPSNIDKVLYLDCDMIINSDISNLCNVDIDGYPIAMSLDEAFFEDEKYQRLNYDKKYPYRNAGVALFNIRHWREHNLVEKCFEYISNNPEKVIFHDQDTLNALLHHRIKSLPIKYNLQTGFLFNAYKEHYRDEIDNIMEAATSPIIIHYTGPGKPWFKGSRHPFVKRYLYYKNISIWSSTPLLKVKYSLKDKIHKLVTTLIWKLGVKKMPKTYIIDKQA